MSSRKRAMSTPAASAGRIDDGLIIQVGLVLVAGLQQCHEVGLECFLALSLDGEACLVCQEDGVLAADYVRTLPDVVSVLVVDLRQREGLPINFNGFPVCSRTFANHMLAL